VLSDDTADAIHEVGHRSFIGGADDFWRDISELQFAFMLSCGLKPSDILIDVGCGSLRGGCKFVSYLDVGHYIGLDKHIELIIYGVVCEIGLQTFRQKRPQFIVSDNFHAVPRRTPTYAPAQSLFTHLTMNDIAKCLSNLRPIVSSGCRFFATFFEVDTPIDNAGYSHSRQAFRYTRQQMEFVGGNAGWHPNYIGNWNHPRGQMMMEFLVKPLSSSETDS
jgi:hypothetical protein